MNTLLDTLIRPKADTEIDLQSCIDWQHDESKIMPHIVLGNAKHPGGQWVENLGSASWQIGTLSYSEMLSLPGYTYEDHSLRTHGKTMPDFIRPSRLEVAEYYKAYPKAVAISDAIWSSVQVADVSRIGDSFLIGSHGICCRHIVLASGIFSFNIPPTQRLAPLVDVNLPLKPLLVIGSGFSAADIILSTPLHRKIIHIYRWSPEESPSPLHGCHYQAYPEYAGIYRQMKLAATRPKNLKSIKSRRRNSQSAISQRDWQTTYEAFPNAEVLEVIKNSVGPVVRVRLEDGELIEREVGALEYVVGRRGNLDYLKDSLREEVLSTSCCLGQDGTSFDSVSGRSLRSKAERDFEVAPNVFIIGSIAGDSLVRHAFGGCVLVAGKLIKASSTGSAPASS